MQQKFLIFVAHIFSLMKMDSGYHHMYAIYRCWLQGMEFNISETDAFNKVPNPKRITMQTCVISFPPFATSKCIHSLE